jgi:hypothetical protein
MHLIYSENEEEKEINFNKCKIYKFLFILIILVENLFCPMQKLCKTSYIEKWKTHSKEVKFKIVFKNF